VPGFVEAVRPWCDLRTARPEACPHAGPRDSIRKFGYLDD
jgi:hypothetical protein